MSDIHVIEIDGEIFALVGASEPPPLDELTETERAVAELAAGGLSDQEIARARSTSIATVVNQLGAVYRKLDLEGRRMLAARLGGRVTAAQ